MDDGERAAAQADATSGALVSQARDQLRAAVHPAGALGEHRFVVLVPPREEDAHLLLQQRVMK